MTWILTPGSESARLRSEAETDAIIREMRSRSPGPCAALFELHLMQGRGETSAPDHRVILPRVVQFVLGAARELAGALHERGTDAPDLARAVDYLQRTLALRRGEAIKEALDELLIQVGDELAWRGELPADGIRAAGTEAKRSWRLTLDHINGPGDFSRVLREMGACIDRLVAAELSPTKRLGDDGAAEPADLAPLAAAAEPVEHILRRKPRQKRN
jgi:hypothetical protein